MPDTNWALSRDGVVVATVSGPGERPGMSVDRDGDLIVVRVWVAAPDAASTEGTQWTGSDKVRVELTPYPVQVQPDTQPSAPKPSPAPSAPSPAPQPPVETHVPTPTPVDIGAAAGPSQPPTPPPRPPEPPPLAPGPSGGPPPLPPPEPPPLDPGIPGAAPLSQPPQVPGPPSAPAPPDPQTRRPPEPPPLDLRVIFPAQPPPQVPPPGLEPQRLPPPSPPPVQPALPTPAPPTPPAAPPLPPIDNSWQMPHGFVTTAVDDAMRVVQNPDEPFLARSVMLVLGALASPLALTEEHVGRPIANIPHSAYVAVQLWARASLEPQNFAAAADVLDGINHFLDGVAAALWVVAPVASALDGSAAAVGAAETEVAQVEMEAETGAVASEEGVDPVVAWHRGRWADLTRSSPTSARLFRVGESLAGAEEITIVDHGYSRDLEGMLAQRTGAEAIHIDGVGYVGPDRLAELLIESGWQGGHVRLVACSTGMATTEGVVFGEQLSLALEQAGSPSVVAAPKSLVWVSSNAARTLAPNLRIGGKTIVGIAAFNYYPLPPP